MLSYSTLMEKVKLLKDSHLELLRCKKNSIRYINPKVNALSLDTYNYEIDVDIHDSDMNMGITLITINFEKTNSKLITYQKNYQGYDDIITINLGSIYYDSNEEIDDVSMTLKYGRLQITDIQEHTILKIPELISETLELK